MQNLAQSLEAVSLQHQRLTHFDYQPFSLPASRVPSRDISNPESQNRPMNTPPLTPAHTYERPVFRPTRSDESRLHPSNISVDDANAITPQTTSPRPSTAVVSPRYGDNGGAKSPSSSRPVSAHSSRAPQPIFVIGPPDGAYAPTSGDGSSAGTRTPSGSGRSTPTFLPPSRPFTPAGEPDDPYARHRRPPQTKNLDEIEARFKFGKSRQNNSSSSLSSFVPDLKLEKLQGSHRGLQSLAKRSEDECHSLGKKKGSMVDLKRFFKSKRRARSPNSGSTKPTTPTAPFDDGITKKYGKFGKVLGSGAGGSVRLMKRSRDGVTFAVKEFRAKHSYETEREYAKKVTAEFCIGSTLHHGNIVETLDIIQERGKWYEVMEYCPFDLFATVMTGKMSREEVACAFMQTMSGVTFLHSMGLAHRDLKLDNVVLSEHGILKIIDFGSASVFRYPFENGIVEAHGIVGSDPYLAPEVCNELKYDPQPADIWSVAIIFCCMTLRRFPWKAPRQSDNSFRLFSSPPQSSSKTDSHHSHIEGSASNPSPKEVTGAGHLPTGPNRLLRILPRESRHIIGRMLELDPLKRATLEEIWSDEWIRSIEFCRQEKHEIIKANNHTHVLEAQTLERTDTSSKKSYDSRKSLK